MSVRSRDPYVILWNSGQLRNSIPYFREPSAVRRKKQIAFGDDDFFNAIRCGKNSAPEREIDSLGAFVNLCAPVPVSYTDRRGNIRAGDTRLESWHGKRQAATLRACPQYLMDKLEVVSW